MENILASAKEVGGQQQHNKNNNKLSDLTAIENRKTHEASRFQLRENRIHHTV